MRKHFRMLFGWIGNRSFGRTTFAFLLFLSVVFAAILHIGTAAEPFSLAIVAVMVPLIFGVLPNEAHRRLCLHFADRLSQVRSEGTSALFRNHDLTMGVGQCIAIVLLALSEEKDFDQSWPEASRWLREIAPKVEKAWQRVVNSDFRPDAPGRKLFETNLWGFIQNRGRPVMEPWAWYALLTSFNNDSPPPFALSSDPITKIIQTLNARFGEALWEILKNDFVNGGYKSEAIHLLASSVILRRTASIQSSLPEIRRAITKLITYHQAQQLKVEATLSKLDHNVTAMLTIARRSAQTLTRIERQLKAISNEVHEIRETLEQISPDGLDIRNHSLDWAVRNGSDLDGIPSQLIQRLNTESASKDPDENVGDLLQILAVDDILVHGAPHIGKTCFVIAAALTWIRGNPDNKALYVNTKFSKCAALSATMRKLPATIPVMVILDDIHISSESLNHWHDSLSAIAVSRPLSTIWVSRDTRNRENLRPIAGKNINTYAFPLERLVRLYTNKLETWTQSEGLVAALIADFDPHVASYLQGHDPPGGDPKAIAEFVHAKESTIFAEWHTKRLDGLTENARLAYYALLTFGTLDMPVSRQLLQRFDSYIGAHLEAMRKMGLCIFRDNNEIGCTEHPFQARRAFKLLEPGKPDRNGLGAQLLRNAGVIRNEEKLSPWPTLPQAVIATSMDIMIETDGEEAATTFLSKAYDYGLWAGTADILHAGMAYWLDHGGRNIPEIIRADAMVRRFKLARVILHPQHPLWAEEVGRAGEWYAREVSAISDEDELKKPSARRDLLLYEQGYLAFLQGNFCEARKLMTKSLYFGIQLLEAVSHKSIDALPNGRANARFVFGNIWVGYSVRLIALFLEWLKGALTGRETTGLAELIKDFDQAWIMCQALRVANNLPDGPEADAAYSRALELLAERPLQMGPYPVRRSELRSDVRMKLGEKEANIVLALSRIPVFMKLAGLTTEAQHFTRTVNPEIRTLRFSAEACGLPFQMLTDFDIVLEKWGQGEFGRTLLDKALGAMCLYKANGYFEDLGWHALLAWSLAADDGNSTKIADAITWFVNNCLDDGGPNGIVKRVFADSNR